MTDHRDYGDECPPRPLAVGDVSLPAELCGVDADFWWQARDSLNRLTVGAYHAGTPARFSTPPHPANDDVLVSEALARGARAERERDEAVAALAEARARIGGLETTLRRLEWLTEHDNGRYCQGCRALEQDGHASWCWVSAALEGRDG